MAIVLLKFAAMKFRFEVGEAERQTIVFNFNQSLSKPRIFINQREVKRNVRLFGEPITETHTLQLSQTERLTVRFEKQRKLLFGQKCRVFLNDRLYRYYEGV